MSKTLLIAGFKGGISNELFTSPDDQTYQSAKSLNVFDTISTLKPVPALVNDAGLPSGFHPYNSFLGSDGIQYFIGNRTTSAASYIQISCTSTLGIPSTYVSATGADIAGTNTKWPLEQFGNSLYWPRSNELNAYGPLSSSPTTTTCSASITTQVTLLKNHTALGKLFYVHNGGKSIGWTSDQTTFTNSALTLTGSDEVVAIEPMGRFLLVGVRDSNYSRKARILVWNGASATVDDTVELNEPGLQTLRVVNGYVEVLCLSRDGLKIYKFTAGYNIGKPVARLLYNNASTTVNICNEAVESIENKLLFGLRCGTGTNVPTLPIDYGIFGYGNNVGDYPDSLNIDRLTSVGAVSATAINSIKISNSATPTMVVTWIDSAGNFYINHNIAGTYGTMAANGVYKSNAYYFDPVFKGKIEKIEIRHKELPASCGFTVKVKQIGAYSDDGTPAQAAFITAATQSQDYSTRTVVNSINGTPFSWCDALQLEIDFDTISGVSAPEIIFPIAVTYSTNEQIIR